MEIPKELHNEIWDYCRVNSITNINDFVNKLIKQGFTIEKFGATPVVKEKIVEKIVEVPVEKIVERIVEVPVAMVDNEMTQKLTEKIAEIEELRKDLTESNDKITQLEKELTEEKKKNKKDIYGE